MGHPLYCRMKGSLCCWRGGVGQPFSEPGLLRASLSFRGCRPSGPAAVGEPGTGGIPVETEAYLGSGCGVVVMSETASKWAWALLERVVSHPVMTRATRMADRTMGTGLILLRRAELRVWSLGTDTLFDVQFTHIRPAPGLRDEPSSILQGGADGGEIGLGQRAFLHGAIDGDVDGFGVGEENRLAVPGAEEAVGELDD